MEKAYFQFPLAWVHSIYVAVVTYIAFIVKSFLEFASSQLFWLGYFVLSLVTYNFLSAKSTEKENSKTFVVHRVEIQELIYNQTLGRKIPKFPHCKMYVSCNSPFDHLSFPHDILKRQSSLKPQQVWFLCYWWKVAATFCQFRHNLLGWYHPFSECNLEKWKKCFFNHLYPILRGCVDLFLFWMTKVFFIILAILQTKIVKKRQYLGLNMLNKIWKHLSRLSSKIPESLSTRLSIFFNFSQNGIGLETEFGYSR